MPNRHLDESTVVHGVHLAPLAFALVDDYVQQQAIIQFYGAQERAVLPLLPIRCMGEIPVPVDGPRLDFARSYEPLDLRQKSGGIGSEEPNRHVVASLCIECR
jgi:hypothetical protein